VNQRSAGSSVPIDEWVDRLELGVHNGGLVHGREIVAVAEGAEVLQQRFNELGRRRDECGGAGIVGTAPDPVLLFAYRTSVILQTGPSKEKTMCFEDSGNGDFVCGRQAFYCPGHRVDVAEHFLRGHVSGALPEGARGFRSEKATTTYLETFDPRGRDGFGAEKQPGEGLGVDESRGFAIQPRNRALGIRDVGGDRAVEQE